MIVELWLFRDAMSTAEVIRAKRRERMSKW